MRLLCKHSAQNTCYSHCTMYQVAIRGTSRDAGKKAIFLTRIHHSATAWQLILLSFSWTPEAHSVLRRLRVHRAIKNCFQDLWTERRTEIVHWPTWGNFSSKSMKHMSQRMSIETVNFELIVLHRDSVDLATSHTVWRALRSLGRKLMQETKKFSHFFSWLKAWISVERFLCSTCTAWYICFSGVGEVIPSSHMSRRQK